MTEKVQRFLNKYQHKLSYSITIDGNKALHDMCRVFPDGSGSYDLAVQGAMDWKMRGGYLGSKITIAPENLKYLYDAVIYFVVQMDFQDINANCVYEKGWTMEHAKQFYVELKRIADYFIENDLVESVYLSLFVEHFFKPKKEEDLDNWCGGTGVMLSVDWKGNYYPCIRYMESSLGDSVEPIVIGHVDYGIAVEEKEKEWIQCLNCINRRTESSDKCFHCPIAEGCSWCSAYNYEVNGTPDSRVTYICDMHIARSLANAYYWNKYYQKKGLDTRVEIHCPKEWAINIISESEFNLLQDLTGQNQLQYED